jgi:cyanophycin synthetase
MKKKREAVTWVQAGREWLGMPGYGFGFVCPSIIGKIRVKVPETKRLEDARADLSSYLMAFLAEPSNESDTSLYMIDTVLRWVAAAQASHQLPAFTKGKVLFSMKSVHGITDHTVAIPGSRMQTTVKILSWVLSEFQDCLQGKKYTPAAFDALERLLSGQKSAMVNSFRFLSAAWELDIPFQDIGGGIYAFGTGNRRRLLRSSFTDETSAIGVQMADYKNLTASILKRGGLPGATHILVSDENQALEAARKIGFPVVVKPADKEQGMGVAAGLVTEKAVVNAYREAKKYGGGILIEKHFPGRDYRLTVFNGRVIKTVNLIPGGVTGDGIHSITKLVSLVQQDKQHVRRARERGKPLLTLDNEAKEMLMEKGLSPHSIPGVDEYIPLRRKANISAGGTSVLVSPDKIHPDNLRLAERAAGFLGLDLAGIDLLIEDISRSWQEIGGMICEVNAQPQIGLGTSPKIYHEILNELLPVESRIPAILVVALPARMDWNFARQAWSLNKSLGVATAEGVWIGGERVTNISDSAYSIGTSLFFDHSVNAALVVMSAAEIRRFGLPADHFDLVLFDDPEYWSDEDRKVAGEAILLLVSHACAIAALNPEHFCLQPHLEKDKLVPPAEAIETGPWAVLRHIMIKILSQQDANNLQTDETQNQTGTQERAPKKCTGPIHKSRN